MDKSALVGLDLEAGSQVLEILDRANVKVSVALWAVLEEYYDPRLIVSGRQFDRLGPREAYGLINDSLDAAGFPIRKMPIILVLPMTDPFIRHLRRVFAKAKSVEGMRLGGQTFGDRFVEDAYVYRIS
jgi:hypothetical protein